MSSKGDNTKQLWEELREKKPSRQGLFLGEENDKFYVAKSESEVYELSALVYYVWLISDGEHTVEQLVDRMSNDIQVNKNEVVEPLLLALKSLSEVGLVRY
jgi:hypothetical protein